MTDEQIATLRAVGASLKTIGAACAESHRHAGEGSALPLGPLDDRLLSELRALRRNGQEAIASALEAFRTEFEGA